MYGGVISIIDSTGNLVAFTDVTPPPLGAVSSSHHYIPALNPTATAAALTQLSHLHDSPSRHLPATTTSALTTSIVLPRSTIPKLQQRSSPSAKHRQYVHHPATLERHAQRQLAHHQH